MLFKSPVPVPHCRFCRQQAGRKGGPLLCPPAPGGAGLHRSTPWQDIRVRTQPSVRDLVCTSLSAAPVLCSSFQVVSYKGLSRVASGSLPKLASCCGSEVSLDLISNGIRNTFILIQPGNTKNLMDRPGSWALCWLTAHPRASRVFFRLHGWLPNV